VSPILVDLYSFPTRRSSDLILVMLVFVGALWGTIVFPVIASVFWDKVTNMAFTWSVVIAMVMFCLVRFELLPMTGAVAYAFEVRSEEHTSELQSRFDLVCRL